MNLNGLSLRFIGAYERVVSYTRITKDDSDETKKRFLSYYESSPERMEVKDFLLCALIQDYPL